MEFKLKVLILYSELSNREELKITIRLTRILKKVKAVFRKFEWFYSLIPQNERSFYQTISTL